MNKINDKKSWEKEEKERQERLIKQKLDAENALLKFHQDDKANLDFFDTKPKPEPLDNKFQIPITLNPSLPLTRAADLAAGIYLRIRKAENEKINLNGKYEIIRTDATYVRLFLEHHFNKCEGDKNLFLDKLVVLVGYGRSVFNEEIEFKNTVNGESFFEWVRSKRDYLFSKNPSSKEPPMNFGHDEFICCSKLVLESYEYFKNELFDEGEVSLSKYMQCFNLCIKTPSNLKFIRGGQIKFVYFLAKLEIKNKIAEERFGIKNYYSQKRRALNEYKPNSVFINRIESILKRRY